MNILIIVLGLLTISFWAYSNVWYQKGSLRYTQGYLIFAVIQWLFILINSIWIWGSIIGPIIFVILITGGAIIITNYTTNQVYRLLGMTPDIGLAFFSVFVWLLGILTIIKIFL